MPCLKTPSRSLRYSEEPDRPKVPLWGYGDESDPQVMAKKLDAAADNGVDAFIFDWYYYNDGPFLDAGLDKGYLNAPNRQRVKFALMWANHDWTDIHPYTRGAPAKLLYPGKVSPEKFDAICDHIIKDYFLQPSYWKIDGKPYFSFYELSKLIDNFGSIPATRAALDRFRSKAVAAGVPGIHLLPMPVNENGSGGSGAGLNGYIAATGVEPVTLGL